MNKEKRNLFVLGITLMLSTCVTTAQWSSNEVLDNIENTKTYNAVVLAQKNRNLSTFANLVALSGLDVSMGKAEDYTVFIPTNEDFKKMSIEEFNHLTKPENKTDLIKFIKWHFLPSRVMKENLKDTQIVENQGQDEITISVDEPFGITYVGKARIIKANIEASNGIIHVIENVIQPKNFLRFGR